MALEAIVREPVDWSWDVLLLEPLQFFTLSFKRPKIVFNLAQRDPSLLERITTPLTIQTIENRRLSKHKHPVLESIRKARRLEIEWLPVYGHGQARYWLKAKLLDTISECPTREIGEIAACSIAFVLSEYLRKVLQLQIFNAYMIIRES